METTQESQSKSKAQFYIAGKGGFITNSANIGISDNGSETLAKTDSSGGTSAGAIGFQFNNTRLEFEISGNPTKEQNVQSNYFDSIKFGYTTYSLNLISQAKNGFNFGGGIGLSSIDISDTDDSDGLTFNEGSAFSMNVGIGYELALDEHFSIILPEAKVSWMFGSVNYKMCVFYGGGYGGCVTDNLDVSGMDFKIMTGLKIKF